MLANLKIENVAVIEKAEVNFTPGFNVLTGETGAGKSIVIDAMGAVLGGRTSRELIRTGASHAFVSAGAGLTGQGIEPRAKGDVRRLDDGNIFDMQQFQHPIPLYTSRSPSILPESLTAFP